jgi:hypothetical protein
MAAITQQTQAIIDYVQAFFNQATEAEADPDDITDQWQSEKNRKTLADLLKTSAPKPKRSTDKLKDPNKPKRGRSAYILFCADERPVAKAALDGAAPTEVTTELGRRWKLLKESTKPTDKKRHQKYEEAAAVDKQRYDDEMVNYVPPSDEELVLLAANKPKRGRKSTKKPTEEGKPKRGRSAYIFYCRDNRPIVKEEMDDAKATEVTTELGRRWTLLRDAGGPEHEKYVKLATDDKVRYESEMTTWDGGDAGAKSAPKTKKVRAEPKAPTPEEDSDATQPAMDDDDDDTDIEEEAFVEEPPKPAPKGKATDQPKKTRKLPDFVANLGRCPVTVNDAKPTVKDAGFAAFAEECSEDAEEVLGSKATKAAMKKHILKEWTALTPEDRAWYAKNEQ